MIAPPRTQMSRSEKGFTLLELMVALFVLSMALAAIIDGVSTHLSNAAHLRDRTFAQWVAMNAVAEYQLADEWPAPGTSNGEMRLGGHEWAWRVTVNTTEDEDVRRLDVGVTADPSDELPLVTMIAYVGRH